MQKLFTFLLCGLFLMIQQTAWAQLPSGSVAPNFTLTDIDGNTHTLYDYLDDGKTVVLDVFAVWCGPCWNYAPTLEQAYGLYGPDGTDEIVFLALEGDDATNDALTNNGAVGDWNAAIPYPIINQTGTVTDLLQIAYFPTIYMICPDHIIYEIDQSPASYFGEFAAENCAVAVGNNNARVMAYNGDNTFCGSFEPSITIQNVGNSPLTQFAVEMSVNGTSYQTVNWTGNLPTFGLASINFNAISATESVNLTFHVSMPNGVADEQEDNDLYNKTVNLLKSSKNISFGITTDKWAEEVHWYLRDPSGNTIAQNEVMSCETSYTYDFELTQDGCYEFQLVDDYGDGLLNGPVNASSHSCTKGDAGLAIGAVLLQDDAGFILWDDASYGDGVTITFYAGDVVVQSPSAGFSAQVVQEINTVNFTNTSSNANTYLWNFGDGTTSTEQSPASHYYAVSGVYQVCLSVTNSAGTDMFCQEVTIDQTTGLEENAFVLENIYPVPAQNVLNISFSLAHNSSLDFTITNTLGQTVQTTTQQLFVGNQLQQIDIENLMKVFIS
ncbi:MAG: PKD domain-containing protein [Chitinophagales bacterium]